MTTLTKPQVLRIIKAASKQAGGQNKLAEQIGLSSGSMADFMTGRRELSERLLSHFGIKRIITRSVTYETT